MQAPDPIEAALMRLMPTALSESGQSAIEGMLDDLAASAGDTVPISPPKPVWHWVMGGGIAAAIAGLITIFPVETELRSSLVAYPTPIDPPGWELVSESDRIESIAAEEWYENSEGDAMMAMRVNAVEENQVLDEESGMIVQISVPREEILLMPITAF